MPNVKLLLPITTTITLSSKRIPIPSNIPKQELPVPEVGRYQLDVEIDDCIVCDLCAKICPVNCIDIESIKSTEAIGETSDGSKKLLYAAKFDIDMAKCMYCGLCTIVCPTECIVMTNQYDKTVFELKRPELRVLGHVARSLLPKSVTCLKAASRKASRQISRHESEGGRGMSLVQVMFYVMSFIALGSALYAAI
jgi:NADH-quinone oxidoreductase subunit I